jgi:hypothetical protein
MRRSFALRPLAIGTCLDSDATCRSSRHVACVSSLWRMIVAIGGARLGNGDRGAGSALHLRRRSQEGRCWLRLIPGCSCVRILD